MRQTRFDFDSDLDRLFDRIKYKKQKARKGKPLLADKGLVCSCAEATESVLDREAGYPPSHGEVSIYLDPWWVERESEKQSWYCQSLTWKFPDAQHQELIEREHGHRIKGA